MYDESDLLNDLDQIRSRYDVLRQLGHDGPWVVHGVRSPASGRHFAVKVMENPGVVSAKPGALPVWQAHTMEKLDHPNLMVLHAVHHLQGGAVAMAMERRRGRMLWELIQESGPLPPAEVERILRDIAAALAYLHGRGVVHRGVRPQSIFLDRDSGDARLAPFGIDGEGDAAPADAVAASILRSLAYLAPEQLDGPRAGSGPNVSARSDLYSLGLVGHTMLTGSQPWEADDVDSLLAARKGGPPPSLSSARSDIPEHLRQAIEGCLEMSPARRWKNVVEFTARLDPEAARPEAHVAAATSGLKSGRRAVFRPMRGAVESVLTGVARRVRDRIVTIDLADVVARVGRPLERQLVSVTRGHLRLVVPALVLGLVVAIGALRGTDDPGPVAVADGPSIAPMAPEIRLAPAPGITRPSPSDGSPPAVLARAPDSTLEDRSVAGNEKPRATSVTRTSAPPPPSSTGLVLLGEPVTREPSSPGMGEPLRYR